MNDFEHEYGLLVEAIIYQAVLDYQGALKYKKNHADLFGNDLVKCKADIYHCDSWSLKKIQNAPGFVQSRIEECEDFFCSRWFKQLWDYDGQKIIDRVNTGKEIRFKRNYA